MTNLNDYKNDKLEKAFDKSEQLNNELKVKLAQCDMRTNNGLDLDEGDVFELAEMMRNMSQAQKESRQSLEKYKK